ncbi:MAG: MASE1 domain-containing protein [Acidobacteria bacterium]|nr:MASE1 domain-containing protein [Acidobacteriota bacterium]
MPRSPGRSILLRVAFVVGTAIAYALLDRLAASFQIESGVSVLFPATAVAIVACMYFGVWGALGVLLGTSFAPWANLESTPQTLLFGAINVIEGALPAIVFRLRPSLSRELRDLRSLGMFLITGTVVNTAISAALGTSMLVAGDPATPFSNRFLVWWLADFAAALLLATPLLSFGSALLRRLSDDAPTRPQSPLAITNTLQVTAAIVILGWVASAAVRNAVATRLEGARLTQQLRANDARLALDRLNSNFLHAQGFLARESAGSSADRTARFDETIQLHERLMSELQPLVVASTPAVLDQYSRLGAKSAAWFKASHDAIARGAESLALEMQAAPLGREFLNLRTSIETADAVSWHHFRKTRERLTVFGLAVDAVVLLILIVAFGTLISRISRPLENLHHSIELLGSGAPRAPSADDGTAFVEIRTLNAALDRAATGLRQHELELQQQTRVAVDASRHKSEFLAKMSHELRTPLNAILGFTELLRDAGHTMEPAKRLRFVENVLRSARLLLGMINDLLEIARLESGRISFAPEVIDVRVVVRNAAAAVQPLLVEKQQTLRIDVPAEPGLSMLDREKLEQVIVKLLLNAIKFSANGDEIVVRARQEGRETEIEVSDRGIGIHPDDHERIFESFEQVYTTGEHSQGTGLGLTVAKRLVEAQGGIISVRSNEGHGATFLVRIPRDLNV